MTKNGYYPAYVYLIEQYGSDYIKIGITSNIKTRLAGLQTSNPKRLILRSYIECESHSNAGELEGHIHKYLKNYSIGYPIGTRNEWFSMDVEDAYNLFVLLAYSSIFVKRIYTCDSNFTKRGKRPSLKEFLTALRDLVRWYMKRNTD